MDPNPIKRAGDQPHTDEQPPTRAMRQALGRLLDQVPGTREVLTHLAALERILKTYGLASLDRMPLAVLDRIVAQLGSLPVKADDRPLQVLQVLLTSTLERRLHGASSPPAPGTRQVGRPSRQPR